MNNLSLSSLLIMKSGNKGLFKRESTTDKDSWGHGQKKGLSIS
jgi:hypothetical protein